MTIPFLIGPGWWRSQKAPLLTTHFSGTVEVGDPRTRGKAVACRARSSFRLAPILCRWRLLGLLYS